MENADCSQQNTHNIVAENEKEGQECLQPQMSAETKRDGIKQQDYPSTTWSTSDQRKNIESIKLKTDLKPVNEKLMYISVTWRDDTNVTGIKWQVLSCSFCEESLSAWKEHVTNHHSANYSLTKNNMVDCSIQCKDDTAGSVLKSKMASPSGQLATEIEKFSVLDNDQYMYHCRSPNCSKVFNKKNKLLLHEIRHNNGYVFKCQRCNKAFKKRYLYKRHLQVHTKAQSCTVCQKSFKNYRCLIIHQREKHSKYASRRKNSKTYSQMVQNKTEKPSEALENNQSVSEQSLPSCSTEEGETSFIIQDKEQDKTKSEREEMATFKQGRKVFQCNMCYKTFPARCYLKRHMLIHTDMQPCSMCWKACKNMRSLQRHLRQAHPGASEQEKNPNDEAKEVNIRTSVGGTCRQRTGNQIDQEIADGPVEMYAIKTEPITEGEDQFEKQNDDVEYVIKIRDVESDENVSMKEEYTTLKKEQFNEGKHKEKSFECEVCNKVFLANCHLRRHMVTHTDTQKCGICHKTYKHLRALERHMKQAHPDIDCETGSGKEISNYKESSFLKTSSMLLRYPCRRSGCEKTFSMLQERVKHEKEEHNGKALGCRICFKTFSSKCHYDRHMETHTESQQCDICQRVCKNARRLRMHRQTHFNRGGGVCQFCGKTFTDKSNLKTHEKIHTNDKKFKCEYCDKCYIKSSDLKMHEQRHTGFRFICMHCGYGCATKLILENHEAMHTGVKAHKCPDCDQCFCTTVQLFNHKLRHQEKRFDCDTCNKKFRWKCDLQTHQRVHLGQRLYKCSMCDKSFVDVSNKNAHIKQVHLGIKRTGHGKKQKPDGGRRSLLDRYNGEATLQDTPSSEAQVISAPLHPTLLSHCSSAGENRLPLQMIERGGQYEGARPDSDFYSMVETLIQFSKDS